MKNRKSHALLTLILFTFIGSLNAQTVFSDLSKNFQGHRTSVNKLVFSNDGNILYTCGGANQILVFDIQSREIIARTEPGESPINELDINFENNLLAYGGYNNSNVIICNSETLETLINIEGYSMIEDLCFSPTSNLLAVVGYEESTEKQKIVIYNADTGKELNEVFRQTSEEFPVAVDFSPDGAFLAYGSCNYNQGIKIWSISDKKLAKEIITSNDINDVEYSSDNIHIAGAGGDNIVYIIDSEKETIDKKLEGLSDIVYTISYSPDGKTISGAGFDYSCTFKSWNTDSGELIQTFGDKGPQINCISYNPQGNAIAVAYRTYGDLFEVPTVRMFYTEESISEVEWPKIDNNDCNLIIEFPEEPEFSVESDKYYKYYDYLLQVPGKSYQVRATEYLYDINDSKRKQTIDKKAQSFESAKSNVSSIDYTLGNHPVFEKIGFKGDLRYHQRVIFIDNVMYSIVYIDYEKEINSEEERFFNSFNVK